MRITLTDDIDAKYVKQNIRKAIKHNIWFFILLRRMANQECIVLYINI